MTALEGKGGVGGGGGGGVGRGTRGDLPIPGGVYIWDLKTQKLKVCIQLGAILDCTMAFVFGAV